MRKEFEEQQKKSILGGGTNPAKNPLQNFDMAAWMAGKTTDSKSNIAPEIEERSGDHEIEGELDPAHVTTSSCCNTVSPSKTSPTKTGAKSL